MTCVMCGTHLLYSMPWASCPVVFVFHVEAVLVDAGNMQQMTQLVQMLQQGDALAPEQVCPRLRLRPQRTAESFKWTIPEISK